MKIRKILLISLLVFILAGCTNINNLNYDDVINNVISKTKNANTFRRGYKLFTPKRLHIRDAGPNYAILSSEKYDYYLYFDLISYVDSKNILSLNTENSIYNKMINYDNKSGHAVIKLIDNDKYLIEIIYNYAKIEVMVDKSDINGALVNTINILSSVKYDKEVIKSMIAEDKLNSTEEVFDLFEKAKNKSDFLDYVESNVDTYNEEEITDTDFIN